MLPSRAGVTMPAFGRRCAILVQNLNTKLYKNDETSAHDSIMQGTSFWTTKSTSNFSISFALVDNFVVFFQHSTHNSASTFTWYP